MIQVLPYILVLGSKAFYRINTYLDSANLLLSFFVFLLSSPRYSLLVTLSLSLSGTKWSGSKEALRIGTTRDEGAKGLTGRSYLIVNTKTVM